MKEGREREGRKEKQTGLLQTSDFWQGRGGKEVEGKEL